MKLSHRPEMTLVTVAVLVVLAVLGTTSPGCIPPRIDTSELRNQAEGSFCGRKTTATGERSFTCARDLVCSGNVCARRVDAFNPMDAIDGSDLSDTLVDLDSGVEPKPDDSVASDLSDGLDPLESDISFDHPDEVPAGEILDAEEADLQNFSDSEPDELSGPSVLILQQPATLTANPEASFQLSCTTPPCTFECSLNGAAWTSCDAAAKFTVDPGEHSLRIRATNAQSVQGPESQAATWKFVGWKSLSANYQQACAVTVDGERYCWGHNFFNQLGLGDIEPRESPTLLDIEATRWRTIAMGYGHACGIDLKYQAFCWGAKLASGTNDDTGSLPLPKAVITTAGPETFQMISAGFLHTCGIAGDSSLWCWGSNKSGALGLGDKDVRLVPAQVTGGDLVKKYKMVSVAGDTDSSFSCAIGVTADALYCWGDNSAGQLGQGNTDPADIPTKVGDMKWTKISLGFKYACGIQSDESLWCWGKNTNGELGVGDFDPRDKPTKVTVGPAQWLYVSTSATHSCGIDVDGSLWCWGQNDRLQLGFSDPSNKEYPSKVDAGPAKWLLVSAGNGFTCGIASDSTIWCWGTESGTVGSLGNGPGSTSTSTPELIRLDGE